MLYKDHRFCYIGEIGVSTYKNSFEPPALINLLEEVRGLKNSGKDLSLEIGYKKVVYLKRIMIESDYAYLLFRYTDPEIVDNIYESEGGKLRESPRGEGEVPAVSAHMVIAFGSLHDKRCAYPASVENVDYLSRSMMQRYINSIIKRFMERKQSADGVSKEKIYRPKIEFRGHKSQTVSSMLNGGAVLKGLNFSTQKEVEDVFASSSYPVIQQSEIKMSIKNSPSGSIAVDLIKRKVDEKRGFNLEKAKIVIEERSGRRKTSALDLSKDDVENSFFIRQERLQDFSHDLNICEDDIRHDVASKMFRSLPE